jgi:hypothetical protein
MQPTAATRSFVDNIALTKGEALVSFKKVPGGWIVDLLEGRRRKV